MGQAARARPVQPAIVGAPVGKNQGHCLKREICFRGSVAGTSKKDSRKAAQRGYRLTARASATIPTRRTCRLETRKITVVVEMMGYLNRPAVKPT